MRTRVDGANRAVLTMLGLLLAAAGILGLVLSGGGFGARRASAAVVPPQMSSFLGNNPWVWWAIAASCVVLALLGLRWLISQLRTDSVSRLDLTTDDREGVTLVHAGALTDAVERETLRIRGVADSSAHVRGEHARRLYLAVDLTDYADIADVRAQIENNVVPHMRQAVDNPDLPVEIELRLSASRTAGRGLR